jgi:hypothetical protein
MKDQIVHPAFRPLSRGALAFFGTAILLYGSCVLLVLVSPIPKAQPDTTDTTDTTDVTDTFDDTTDN